MAKLLYSAITSLDGYVADEGGSFGWAAPDEDGPSVRARHQKVDAPAVIGERGS
jgi:hypothetical protein